MRQNWILTALICLCLVIDVRPALAICKEGNFLNPLKDVCWKCIFPVKIGGIPIGQSRDLPDSPDCPARKFFCKCKYGKFERHGIAIAFWEPARLVETVKDPYCFPALGMKMKNNSSADLSGCTSSMGNEESMTTFAQAHYYIFPAWLMLEETVNTFCFEESGFDLAYITEVDALWNDDLLSALITPEAYLFANLRLQLLCIADSVSANAWLPLAPLFWCMGSWGSVYPLTGHNYDEDLVQANAGIGARMIYKLGRQGLLRDPGVVLCYAVSTPIWIKWHYRMQIAKPVKHSTCTQIGASGLKWAFGKNPSQGSGSDNFVFIIFRKRACCAS